MNFILRTIKNMALDILSMLKGFTYGFIMVGLMIGLLGGAIYGVLYLRNLFL
ncbi:hypothetical protein VKA52_18150 [Halobacillus sp. HZG1]|uniref:hypothetical protein n=1 Tax=Halobacillus sp. HZG1 TaxID=3111769 RepID=UPI002DBB60E9|nr:hypothetical protein [Halobacillus sp. HZG1]MEC3885648.1 hypothetical protein [Halobacillus sp. HZG1]